MKRYILFPALLLVYSCAPIPGPPEAAPLEKVKWTYPEARQGDVVDDYHGTMVADPYRWLEDPDAEETRTWVEAQNKLTHAYLDAIPAREKFKQRLTELWNYPKYGVPSRHGERYYYFKNDGLQNQSVLYTVEKLGEEPEVVLDPNTWSEDGTIALTGRSFTEDGRYMAYGQAQGGSDWQSYYIIDLAAGQDLDDVIQWTKFTSIAWEPDNSGFYYTRFPEEAYMDMTVDQTRNSKVYWHRLGAPQSEDVMVYHDPEHPDYGYSPYVTEDGKYLLIYVWLGTDDRNGLYYRELGGDGELVHLFEVGEAQFYPAGNVGSTVYFQTNLDAPKSWVFSMDLNNPQRENWKTIIPEGEDAISSVSLIGGRLIVQYMHNAYELVKIYDLQGNLVRDLDLPALGTLGGMWGKEAADLPEMFFSFTSFLYPSTVFRYDVHSGDMQVVWEPGFDLDPAVYETKQVFYPSKDGTPVSMFITHKKGIALDHNNPTLLYAYGGFNIPILPGFSITGVAWMEAGGVYAVANLRGGSEYGEEWHKDGMLENKQNVFDDFIAAGEWLIENGYTSREKLAINGGSNGGLLVAACLVQRPDLFAAAVPQVPVIDMLRYHMFTAGRYWTVEYGNAEENPEHFKFMYAYSPLHNVKEGVTYPPTFITSADTDDRVVSMHAKKFAATLQAKDTGVNPILIRVETKAGHGAGKPTTKRIDEAADIYAFIMKNLGMTLE
ncbi:MAG: prolyl oligopeptidase family protein [Candidatus Neomarinimicrobiota bacterium]